MNKRPGRIEIWEGLSKTTSDVWKDSSKSGWLFFPKNVFLRFYPRFANFGKTQLSVYTHRHTGYGHDYDTYVLNIMRNDASPPMVKSPVL